VDLLTNTVVQIVVNGAGKPVSLSVLSKSGLPEADEEAIKLARLARFQPLPMTGSHAVTNALADLNWGKLVFEWHTGPLPPR
jgi:TonB family protein